MQVEIKEPDCPGCGQPPKLVISPLQAFCGNEECGTVCWNQTMTRAELQADFTVIDLSGLPPSKPRDGDAR